MLTASSFTSFSTQIYTVHSYPRRFFTLKQALYINKLYLNPRIFLPTIWRVQIINVYLQCVFHGIRFKVNNGKGGVGRQPPFASKDLSFFPPLNSPRHRDKTAITTSQSTNHIHKSTLLHLVPRSMKPLLFTSSLASSNSLQESDFFRNYIISTLAESYN